MTISDSGHVVGVEEEFFSLKVVPTKLVSSQPVEFYMNDIITSTLFNWWYNLFAPCMSSHNASKVFVFPHVQEDRDFDFAQPFSYAAHKADSGIAMVDGMLIFDFC